MGSYGPLPSRLFRFELPFAEALRCIPMAVRMRLDLVGLKLSLAQWSALEPARRQALFEAPVDSPASLQAWGQQLQEAVRQTQKGEIAALAPDPAPAWLQPELPDAVLQQAQQNQTSLAAAQWSQLGPLERFALVKLSRPGHENRNFLPALREFFPEDGA